MSKLGTLVLVMAFAMSDLGFIYWLSTTQHNPPPSPPPKIAVTYLELSSRVTGQAGAAGDQNEHARASLLYLQAAGIEAAAKRNVPQEDAAMFDPTTDAFLAKQEWSMAHPDSTELFNKIVDGVIADKDGAHSTSQPLNSTSRR